jgi:hypothetical protein
MASAAVLHSPELPHSVSAIVAPDPARLQLSDFPIPANVTPDASWTTQMREIADHIGARATLLFCASFGGKSVYIPQSGCRGAGDRLSDAIGAAAPN